MASESAPPGLQQPFAKFSLKRRWVQMLLALLLILVLNIVLLADAIADGNTAIIVPGVIGLVLIAFTGYRFVQVALRATQLAVWIRQMGAGNLDYQVQEQGQQGMETTEAARALEKLRKNSIDAKQLDPVRKLSQELQEKNEELERVLAELRQTQNQIVLRQKLVELGELTAGVAHEIRNPLNFMKNFSEACEELVNELREAIEQHAGHLDEEGHRLLSEIPDELAENLARIRSHGDRADRTVRDMVMIGRGGGNAQPVSMNDLLNDRAMLALHSAQASDEGFELDLRSDCDPGVGELEVVPDEMGRVFLNLVGNACYATHEKRRTADQADQDDGAYQPTLWLRTERVDGEIVIRIRDNGTGIPPDSMDKIFNPFYTTKPSGAGVGLGLSLCNDVIRQHGGSITADSEPGEFTEMTIRLPAT